MQACRHHVKLSPLQINASYSGSNDFITRLFCPSAESPIAASERYLQSLRRRQGILSGIRTSSLWSVTTVTPHLDHSWPQSCPGDLKQSHFYAFEREGSLRAEWVASSALRSHTVWHLLALPMLTAMTVCSTGSLNLEICTCWTTKWSSFAMISGHLSIFDRIQACLLIVDQPCTVGNVQCAMLKVVKKILYTCLHATITLQEKLCVGVIVMPFLTTWPQYLRSIFLQGSLHKCKTSNQCQGNQFKISRICAFPPWRAQEWVFFLAAWYKDRSKDYCFHMCVSEAVYH